jgi:hypothetical protein
VIRPTNAGALSDVGFSFLFGFCNVKRFVGEMNGFVVGTNEKKKAYPLTFTGTVRSAAVKPADSAQAQMIPAGSACAVTLFLQRL